MEQYNKKSISDDLKIYDHLAKDSDFIEAQKNESLDRAKA